MDLKKTLFIFMILLNAKIYPNLANLTRNDPFPLFSSVYPYCYLTTKQKSNLIIFNYNYPQTTFRSSFSGYRQFADYARDQDGDSINLGDCPRGRWNMLGLFYDPILRDKLINLLGLSFLTPEKLYFCTETIENTNNCYCLITDPQLTDPNKEFGFFSIPALYRKYGLRFENEFLLIDRCFYSVGIKIQVGVSDIKQMPFRFEDFTCQALGIACPASDQVIVNKLDTGTCSSPSPSIPQIVNPAFSEGSESITVPPCSNVNGPTTSMPCVTQFQPFEPCCNQKLCLSFSAECKKIVIDYIMKQRAIITKYLGVNALKYDHIGLEDFRFYLFWRQIFVINEEDENYPRLLFTPFIEAGAAVPLDSQLKTDKFFGLATGNNSHISTGVTFGCTLDFLETIDFIFQVGFTKFFEREYCNYRLPTNEKESGLYPYTADIKKTPGTTWFTGFGFNAYRFLDNLSLWLEYLIIKHREDDIKVCKSYIPSTSIYYNRGFLVKYYETLTRWGTQFVNAGFNYDLSDDFSLGFLLQIPTRERNSFKPTTIMGTVNFVY